VAPVIPEDLRYTAAHEWVRTAGEKTVRVGITDYAQEALGDIVFVQLPEVGSVARPGEPIGEIESTKSVSDLFAPVAGTVTARNEDLDDRPELVNLSPYENGWMVEIELEDPAALDALLDPAAYQDLTAQS
jgi:glycine cleavage system H protein